jgi:hypothetical protein
LIEEARIGMSSRKRKTPKRGTGGLDIGRLLQPANAFADPMAVVDDQDLTLTEKRAILSAWASDARSAEMTFHRSEDAKPVRFDNVMDALKELDRRYGLLKSRPRYRRILERRVPGVFGREDDADKPGPALS